MQTETDRLILRRECLRFRLARLHASAERLRCEMEQAEKEWALIGEALDRETRRRDERLATAARALVDLVPGRGR